MTQNKGVEGLGLFGGAVFCVVGFGALPVQGARRRHQAAQNNSKHTTLTHIDTTSHQNINDTHNLSNAKHRHVQCNPIQKTQYLGGERERKRAVKASEKMRFKFDWEAAEDTSR